jgi:hypothetical protein
MTKFEATRKIQDLIRQINRVKMEYDRNYLFYPRSFFNQYMSVQMIPLFKQITPLFDYLPDEEAMEIQVEERAWTGQGGTIALHMWMYFFDNWMNLSR